VRAYVGVTDGDWYRHLADRPELTEANFWRPGGGREFGALAVGEPFFFKTHHPHNRVVGGGFYSDFARLKVSEAWDFYGAANGAQTYHEMRRRISRYRRGQPGDVDPYIGCVLLRDVRYFPDDGLAESPPQFAPSVVQGKTYDLADPQWQTYFQVLLARLLGADLGLDLGMPWSRTGPVYGDPRLSPYRLGQRAFQAVVLNAYERRCAITGDKIRPVLQAAHIRPVAAEGENRLDNGLLLRSDVHTLYDRDYLGVDTSHRLLVSPRLRDEFGNGEQFYSRAGQTITLPRHRNDRPNRTFLEWHLDEKFQR
jgi:putative restriction endonuclease